MSAQVKVGRFKRARVWLAAAVVTLGVACVSTPPPVQEMSDARQAIAAARSAGAEKYAPQVFRRSLSLLRNAERTLKRRSYQQARNQALAARRLAIEAQEQAAQAARDKP